MDYYKKYLKYKSKYTVAKENMRGGGIDILDYYKKTVGIITYTHHDESHAMGGFIKDTKQSYCHKVISEHSALIERFNTSFIHLGTDGHGLGAFISIVKEWTHHMELIFALALESSSITLIKPYLLFNKKTIYPMCLRFVCRLVLNDLFKEKEDLYCLLKKINYDAGLYWNTSSFNTSTIPLVNNAFTPKCLLDTHMPFPDTTSRYGRETKDTLYAWFGIMNPNEFGGLVQTKIKIINFIDEINKNDSSFKKNILQDVFGLTHVSETGIIRQNYNSPGNTLTVSSIATLLLS